MSSRPKRKLINETKQLNSSTSFINKDASASQSSANPFDLNISTNILKSGDLRSDEMLMHPSHRSFGGLDLNSDDEDAIEQQYFHWTLTELKTSTEKHFQVFKDLRLVDGQKVLLCFLFLLLLTFFYRISQTLDAYPNHLLVLVAYILSPIKQAIETARLTFLTIPDLLQTKQFISHTTVDYEILIARLLDDHRFSALLEGRSKSENPGLDLDLERWVIKEIDAVKNVVKENELKISTEMQLLQQSLDIKLTQGISGKVKISEFEMKVLDLETVIKTLQTKLNSLSELNKYNGVRDTNLQLSHWDTLNAKQVEIEDFLHNLKNELKACKLLEGNINERINLQILETYSNNSTILNSLHKEFVSRKDLTDKKVIERDVNRMKRNLEGKVRMELTKVKSEIENVMTKNKEELLLAYAKEPSCGFSVEEIVKEALEKYDADKTGLFDFALESAGGSIISTRCTENYEISSAVLSVWGLPIWWESKSPRAILQPDTSPGQCWAFKGSHGSVVVKLSANVMVKAVSIEHISHFSSPDGQLASAPKNMSLGGIDGDKVIPLLNFTYDKTGDPVQTFWFNSHQLFDTVELNIMSNHGHPDYTCIYRFRVHGDIAREERIH